jgi:membrane-bound metal-dependent hydrolase YbcI (DUF457 family)
MVGTGHLLIGGAVGVGTSLLLPAPLAVPLALGLGIVSHHLLDLTPHTDAATFWPSSRPIPRMIAAIVAGELLIGLCLTLLLFFSLHTQLAFICGAIGGMVPDILDEVPWWSEGFRKTALGAGWHRWHLRLHCASMENTWMAGIVIDVAVIGAGLWLLLV